MGMIPFLALLFISFFTPVATTPLLAAKLPSQIPSTPPKPIVDQAHLIPAGLEQQLNTLLRHFHQGGKAQIALLTLDSLGSEAIESLSIQIVERWKLGDAKKDNGILLLVAKKERRIRIEVGQGLEGTLTDAHSKRIIDEHILPFFKKGDFAGGLRQGVLAILERIDPAITATQKGKIGSGSNANNLRAFGSRANAKASPKQRLASRIITLIFLAILFILFITNPRLFFFLLMGMMIGGGRRGGFGGGGGFGSYGGGGGGFSGGGASGSW